MATGPVSHRMVLRDGRKGRGILTMDILMEQTSNIECRLSNMVIEGYPNNAFPIPDTQLVVSIPSSPATNRFGNQKASSPASSGNILLSSSGWTCSNAFAAEGSIKALLTTPLEFSLVGKQGSVTLASGYHTLADIRCFMDGEKYDFSLPLETTNQGTANKYGTTLSVFGTAVFSNIPVFCQMDDGSHDGEKGIIGATFLYPDIPNQPRVPLFDANGKEINIIAGGIRAKAVRGKTNVHGDTNLTIGSGARVNLTTPLYPPGSGKNPPAITERLFGGATGLPVCWLRRADDTTGQVAFENLCTGSMETALPIDQEYVVTVPASATGPLGLQLEPNFSGTQRFGFRSGRRNSGYDIGAVVRNVRPDAILGKFERIRPGHHLISINGQSTLKLTFTATVDTLKGAGRPLVLRFHDPYAVPGGLAAQAAKANINDKQSMGNNLVIGGRRVNPHDVMRKSYAGTVPVMAFTKKTKEQAQATLDLALSMLGRVNVAENDARAAAAITEGRVDDESVKVQKALMDAGFLRTVAVTVTGVPGDVAPPAVRERLEAEAKAAAEAKKREAEGVAGEENAALPPQDDDRDLTEESANAPAAKMHTSDSTASNAMSAIGHLASTPNADPAIQAIIDERTKRMADVGAFQRSLAAMQSRAAAFAENALSTMAHIAKNVPKTSDLGLNAQSLIIVQQASRKHEYRPGMADEIGGLVKSLANENREQDGAGFLKLFVECLEGITDLSAKGYFRAKAPNGKLFFLTPGNVTVWEQPAEMTKVLNKFVLLDRVSRLMEDAAVPNATTTTATCAGTMVPILTAVAAAIDAQQDDPFVVAVILSAAAKLAALPSNAGGLVAGHILHAVDAILAAHPTDMRICEAITSLYFNIGRDLDYSEPLLIAGVVGKVTALARSYMQHRSSWTGTICQWPPAGREDEVGEVIVLPGTDRMSRDKNILRPRLVRACINVLINLACYRRPIQTTGATSVDLIVSNRGVELLGETLLAHINDASVVTSVLNCAANIAFKNREVQLAIGAMMTDAIILSGWSFVRDANLLSMALRAIGNLTNEDANIYRGLGFGVSRMISAAMRANFSDVSLQTLAASVLSNIASVEPVEHAAAAEDVADFVDSYTARRQHPAEALKPTVQDMTTIDGYLHDGKFMWQIAPWLLVEEGAVGALVTAMTKYSTDVTLVEACLRTLLCVAGEEDVTTALTLRHDLVAKTLFVMRASDFNVSVQASGTALLLVCAALPSTRNTVVASDAALTMLMAIENHKSSLSTALNSAIVAITGAADIMVSPKDLITALDSSLDGKAHAVLNLATKVCDTVSLLTSARASKAAIELGSPQSLTSLLQAALTILNTLARRGFSFVAPQAGSRILADIIAFCEAASLLLGDWIRHPSAKASNVAGPDGSAIVNPDEEAACFAVRNILTGGGRSHTLITRFCEMCVTGTGAPGSPATLAVTPRVARAILGIPSSLIIRGAALLDRASGNDVQGNIFAPYLEVDGAGIEGLISNSAVNIIGALLLAIVGAVVHYLQQSVNMMTNRGTVTFDTAAVTSRAAAAQGIILLDILGSVGAPPAATSISVSDENGNTTTVINQPPPGADPATISAAIMEAASGAIQASALSSANFLSKDLTPVPLRMTDLVDLGSRVTAHLNNRSHAVLSGNINPIPPVTTLSEARAIYTFSVSRARSQVSVSAIDSGYRAGVTVPSSSASVPPTMSVNAPRAPVTSTVNPTSNVGTSAMPANNPYNGGGGGGHDAQSVNLHHGHGGKTLKRSMSSRAGFVGPLAGNGIHATAWIENKPHPVLLKCSEEVKDLLLYTVTPKKGVDTTQPLAIVPGGAFVAVRIGKPIKEGKSIKSGGGLFSKGPKSDRTVCLDSNAGNTLVQLELTTIPLANELATALEGLSTVAARLAEN